MLGKLIKYEYKSTKTTYLLIYCIALVVAIINRISRAVTKNNLDGNIVFGISAAVLFVVFFSLGIITIVVCVERFKKNFLSDEGYLMFTLPVKVSDLIISKLIITVFWNILNVFTGLISFVIVLGDKQIFKQIFMNFGEMWDQFSSQVLNVFNINPVVFIIIFIVLIVVAYTMVVFHVYLTLSVSQLPLFSKNKVIITIIVFCIIHFLISAIVMISEQIAGCIVLAESPIGIIICLLISLLIICTALYMGIKYILEKHLNLE